MCSSPRTSKENQTLNMPAPRPLFRLALCTLSLAACAPAHAPAPAAVQVGYVTLAESEVTLTNELTGRVVATATAEVRPQVDGVIRQRLFQEGSRVRAGQPLYQIDPRSYRASRDTAAAQLANARAALVTARARAARYQSLSDADAASRQDVDDAIANANEAAATVRQYEANLRTADLSVEYTRVLAPISGRIGRSSVTAGALVNANQTDALATIQQLDPIYVDIVQSSAQILQLRRNLASGALNRTSTSVHLKLEDGSTYNHTGNLEFAEVNVDENTGAVVLRARFPNPDGLLMPGMFVRMQTPFGALPHAVLAPQQGITRDATGDATALVIDEANKVVLRHVTANTAIGNKWVVENGLSAGDRLIVQGTDRARAGQTVHPVAVNLEQAAQ
jgi:membrane fusion protein (multidrug efflux system)